MPGNTPPDTPSSKLVPLTQNQLKAILDAARRDDLLHPLLTAAAYTGLRLGDLCNLKWSAVDLAAGFVTVPATTTHQTVKLPILPPLREVFESRHASRDKNRVFVFPEAARRYNSRNEHGVPTLRGSLLTGVKVFIGQALNAVPLPDKPDEAKSLPPVPDVMVQIQNAGFTPRKATRIATTYRLFREGRSYSQITAVTGRSKGQCSEDLHTVETLIGYRLRPGKPLHAPNAPTSVDLIQLTRRATQGAPRQTSLYGWRSFRPVFCLLALEAGLPTETIEQVVGRATLAQTLKYLHDTKDLPATGGLASRALALARDVITPRQTALVNAVLHAAGIEAEADPDPKRALSLLGTAVVNKTRARITAALRAAGILDSSEKT